MMKFFASLIFIISNYNAQCQKDSRIELSPFYRFDWYPKFAYNYQGRASTDNLKMSGQCFGIDVNYRMPISRNYGLIAGVGFNRLLFNRIESVNSIFGKSTSRAIRVPSFSNVGYSTDRYFYNNLGVTVGITNKKILSNSITLYTGIVLRQSFAFSENYHLTNLALTEYKANKLLLVSQSAELQLSGLKKYRKFQIGPKLICPLFSLTKKDYVFREVGGAYRSNWFNGAGAGICIVF